MKKEYNMVKISFSWDDGAVEDLKLMDLLMRYSIPSIFFIPATNQERPTINKNEIKTIYNNGFEIGAHTYSHSYLTRVPNDTAVRDIVNGKEYLEQLLGNEVPHFCFPGGSYNKELVKQCSDIFTSARTADTGAVFRSNTFLIKPAFHFFNRGKRSLIYNSLKNNSPIFYLVLSNLKYSDYFDFVRHILDDIISSKGDYGINIWGHSWEIEEYGLWNRLEDLFKYLTNFYSKSISGYSEIVWH